MSIPKVLARMGLLGHVVFEGELNLNLIGIRKRDGVPDVFDDTFLCVYQHGGKWIERVWPCTTDPGLYWLQNPMNVSGTAILVPGQYKGAWRIGSHQGKYDALVQCAPVKVFRDRNGNGKLDMDGQMQEGLFGINIHRASSAGSSSKVDKWSAGCQVLQSSADFASLMALANESAKLYGPRFTYTLLDEY